MTSSLVWNHLTITVFINLLYEMRYKIKGFFNKISYKIEKYHFRKHINYYLNTVLFASWNKQMDVCIRIIQVIKENSTHNGICNLFGSNTVYGSCPTSWVNYYYSMTDFIYLRAVNNKKKKRKYFLTLKTKTRLTFINLSFILKQTVDNFCYLL